MRFYQGTSVDWLTYVIQRPCKKGFVTLMIGLWLRESDQDKAHSKLFDDTLFVKEC